MNGCPVKAYEKDPVTGIVRHLDDQCIGCQYCVLTCPYEVPQFNSKRGIVRKCDMCSDRLAASEAPACVQSCPNQAITIQIVDKSRALEDAQTGQLPAGRAVAGDHRADDRIRHQARAARATCCPRTSTRCAPGTRTCRWCSCWC